MGEILQQVFLSDFMIFVFMGLILLLITGWMFSLREFAGYVLGWLIGIFLIIVLSTVVTPPDFVAEPMIAINLVSLMIPSALGLMVGFGVMTLAHVGGSSESRVARALTIAILVCLDLVIWYFMLLSDIQTRVLLAIFVLTFAIGALFHFILLRSGIYGSSRHVIEQRTVYEEIEPVNSLEMGDEIQPYNAEQPPNAGDRVRSFRERVRRYRG